jgi:polyisoprenoid-binding protein YceI
MMVRRRSLVGFMALLGALALSVGADAKMSRAGGAAVSFVAVGPAGMKIEGKSGELAVSEEGDDLIVSVPLSPLTTGIELRDKHMREKYLEVGKYPTAELRVPKASIHLPEDGQTSSGDATGTMKLHGRTKSVPFHYEAKRNGPAYVAKGSVRVNMKAFGIEVPSYMGVTVKPDVNVSVAFGAVDR